MSLLPQQYLDAVVAIEVPKEDKTYRAIATGFLVGFSIGEKNQEGEELFKVFLVTNKHVFQEKKIVFLRFNAGALGSKKFAEYEIHR